MIRSKLGLLAGTAFIGMMGAQPSLAQQASAQLATADAQDDEIVVTAQKREERLQDVPISIVALGGAKLDRSTDEGVADALEAVAGVNTIEGRSGVGSQISIRGVAPVGSLLGGSNPVAYYLDTVPFGFARHAVTPDAGAFDLERVEVLRGPQGTLYGANALNGVVRVLTHEPDLKDFAVKARAGLSSTQYAGGTLNYRADAAVNVPLIEDKLALRVVGGYQKFAGWIDKPNDPDANDGKLVNFRVKLKAHPTERLTIDLSFGLSRQDFGAYSIGLANRTQPLSPVPEPQASDYDLYSGTIAYDLDFAQLISTTSYLKYRAKTPLDYGPFELPWIGETALEADVFSHETVLNSSSEGPWRWSLGFFYRDAKDRTIQPLFDYQANVPVDFGAGPFLLDWRDYSKSYAIFGEVTRELTPQLSVTGGLRYFKDKVRIKDLTGNTPNDSARFKDWSPRAVLSWKPDSDVMAYASFSKGFRSGIIQVPDTAALGVPPASPDKLYNYEIGTKFDALNGLIGFEAAVFYIDWKDIILAGVPVTGSSGVPTAATTNAAGANGIGFELSANLRPARGLTLSANVGWNDLHFSKDSIFNNGSGPVLIAAKGSRPPQSPELTTSGSIAYEFPVGSGAWLANVGASARYVSKYSATGAVGTNVYSDPQFIGRVSAGVRLPDRWDISLYVDNVTNEQGVSAPEGRGILQWDGRPRPRTIGAQIGLQF